MRQSLNDCLVVRFVYDGPNVVMELSAEGGSAYGGNASNEVVRAYVNGPGMDQPIERLDFIHGTPRNRQVFHADGLGSIAALTDEGGEPVQTYTYAALGGIRARTGTDLNRVTYTAREALGDSLGFYYYRNRVLDPNTGRFTSEDPLGFVGGVNRYGYVLNSPLEFRDPYGEDLCYGNAFSSETDYHQKVEAGNYGQSFGPVEGTSLWGKMTTSQDTPGPSPDNKGDGIVYDNSAAKMIKVLERTKTTPEEDEWLKKEMQKELGKRGDYGFPGNSCRSYSQDCYKRMKKKLCERRENGEGGE